MSKQLDAWVRADSMTAARLPLLCFPHAGGGGLGYRSWSQGLPAHVGVWPIELPGRESRVAEAPFRRIPALVDALVEALSGHLDRPYALFGHSMGAVLAFEFARGLRRVGGRGPELLVVSARRGPTVYEVQPTRLHDRPDVELVAYLRRLGGTPREVLDDPAMASFVLGALRADFEMLETWAYTPELALDCPILAFAGRSDPHAPATDVARWRELTTGAFELCELPGDHFFIHPERAAVLERIGAALDRPHP
ncbi:thioesterase II family protein [Enhygromyxa salina]|uniref:Linear gramicidin dehydrogenase LgrE n=1 Tax=Enhygromyxa salina TaxID=215803 RepID=A0A2S9YN60_9BACT|nr:alpha/beta fold hydrolase [Enhygromyxa salina]PRQ06489.1 Linear gramicidin dehydrogenase LgrE [Enhygromyxa salina]